MLIKRTKPVDDFNLYFQVELIFSAGRKSVVFSSIFHPAPLTLRVTCSEFAEAYHVQHNFSKRLATCKQK